MTGNYLILQTTQLRGLIEDPSTADALVFPEDEAESDLALDIDKSWHLIHFLLNGATWEGTPPFGWVVLGGRELPNTDAGYGPYRVLEPEEVKSASVALEKVAAEELWSRFRLDVVRKADIYPSGWIGSGQERDYILHHYRALQAHFARAASKNEGMLLYIA